MERTSVLALSLVLLASSVSTLAGCGGEPKPSVDVRYPSDPAPSLLFEDVAVLEVDTGQVAEHRDVLVEGEVITGVAPHGELEGVAGRVIDGRGATLLPGLIDMHGHIAADTGPSWERGLPDAEANLRAYAYSGVTTVFDPSDPSGADAWGRRARVAKRELVGPRIYSTGRLLTAADGHPIAIVQQLAPWWIGWYLEGQVGTAISDVLSAEGAVDALAEGGADAVKIVIDAIPLEAPRLSPELAAAVVARAKQHGLRTVAHVGTTRDAIEAADAGVALWVHGVYKERIPDDQIAVLAGYGIPVVATIEVFDRYGRASRGPIVPTRLERETVPAAVLESFHPIPDDFEIGTLADWVALAGETMDVRVDNVRRLRAAGVTILAGSDTQSGVFPGAGLHRELAHLVRAGMTPAEAIRAATLDAAVWLADGSEPDAGLVAEGKRADLLLVEGDPSLDLEALQRIRAVYLAGVEIERHALENP